MNDGHRATLSSTAEHLCCDKGLSAPCGPAQRGLRTHMNGTPPGFWLVTFVTHNSRRSTRMDDLNIRAYDPVILAPHDQAVTASSIAEAIQKYRIGVLTFNVLPDHVHLIIASRSEADLGEDVRKIKGLSSHAVRRANGWVGYHPVWAQKFHRRSLSDERMLVRAMGYVRDNHLKHQERWGESLITTWEETIRPVVDIACSDVPQALRYAARQGAESPLPGRCDD
jgi:REP element-mobilizing transposase RayT